MRRVAAWEQKSRRVVGIRKTWAEGYHDAGRRCMANRRSSRVFAELCRILRALQGAEYEISFNLDVAYGYSPRSDCAIFEEWRSTAGGHQDDWAMALCGWVWRRA